MFDVEKVTEELVQWIKDWFDKNGKNCKAVIGISGGKDSSIVAALCVAALGKERVFGVLMPNGCQADIEDAYKLVNHLKIEYKVVNIESAVNAVLDAINLDGQFSFSEQTRINLPPRIRMTTLYTISQSMNGRVINTCNLSENYVGYSTRWGDDVGDVSPLGNLTVTEVKAIGKYLGLPIDLVEKTPSDGLCAKTDEDNLGFTYATLDKYIRTGICEDTEIKTDIDRRHEASAFKMEPMDSFISKL